MPSQTYLILRWLAQRALEGRTIADAIKTDAIPKFPSPPFRGEREGPTPKAWEVEAGVGEHSGIPRLTPTLSVPRGGEGATGFSR
jgi:hypothetical protein